MFATENDLKDAILRLKPATFVSRYLFEPVPHSFAGDLGSWVEWKHQLGDLIDVDPKDIVLTGSSALGYSLNPTKNFKVFDEASDIDCGIISEHYFSVAWRHLRKESTKHEAKAQKLKDAIKEHRKYFVFQGTIAADRMLAILPFGHDWLTALEIMATVPPTVDRDVKLRIYKDYDSLRYYQARNLQAIKDSILSESSEEQGEAPIEVQSEEPE